MKIAALQFFPVSVPYTHREVSSLIQRDGGADVIVKAVADDGRVGWGESCSGANVESVHEALKAMTPFALGRSPWDEERTACRDFLQTGDHGRRDLIQVLMNHNDFVTVR